MTQSTAAPDAASPPTGWSVWLAAARPRTLPAAIVPVTVGLAIAGRYRVFDFGVALATVVAALLIQIGTNLANDYYDYVAGADTKDRLGPIRVTQAGLVEPALVKAAAYGVLGLAALIGLYLAWHGGWPIVAIGLGALASALAYTAGPFPLAYNGLGDLFVFVFFGLIAVNGTVYLQLDRISELSMLVSVPVACLATAILVVNNLRDIPTDSQAGKRTLAVRIGAAGTRLEYVVLMATAFLFVPIIAIVAGPSALLALLALPIAIGEIAKVYRRSGVALNQSLAATARLHLIFGLLLAAGMLV